MNKTVRDIMGVLVCAALAALVANYGVAALMSTVLSRAEARDLRGAVQPCHAPEGARRLSTGFRPRSQNDSPRRAP